jgi:DNA replication protein
MKQFEGFPARMQFTPVPNLFLSRLVPQIDDINELKTTLHLFRIVYTRRGFPQYVTRSEMLADSGLAESLKAADGAFEEILDSSLDKAAGRGTVISIEFGTDETVEKVYLVNTEKNREAAEKITTGEIELSGLSVNTVRRLPGETEQLPDIFTLYEENVGMLNPMIAEWLKEAEKLYPGSWIRDAIKEAVSLNKRNWRYIDRILENWAAEGRDDGAHRRDSKTGTAKYGKQKYGHMVKH